MTALTADIQPTRYGVVGDVHQPLNYPLSANTTIYRGSVALLSGSGGNQGYLKNASSPASSDIVVGLVGNGGPGYANYSPGIANTSSVSGAVTVEVETGSFYFVNDGTVTQANVGGSVNCLNEYSATTNGSLPKLGTLLAIDPNPPAYAIGNLVVALNVPNAGAP